MDVICSFSDVAGCLGSRLWRPARRPFALSQAEGGSRPYNSLRNCWFHCAREYRIFFHYTSCACSASQTNVAGRGTPACCARSASGSQRLPRAAPTWVLRAAQRLSTVVASSRCARFCRQPLRARRPPLRPGRQPLCAQRQPLRALRQPLRALRQCFYYSERNLLETFRPPVNFSPHAEFKKIHVDTYTQYTRNPPTYFQGQSDTPT